MTNEVVITFGDEDNTGVSVIYNPDNRVIEISGWYDGGYSIEGGSMPITEFFHRLGIDLGPEVLGDALSASD